MHEGIKKFQAERISLSEGTRSEAVSVAVEEEFLLEIEGSGSYRFMCTPSDLKALAIGFALSEGLTRNLDGVEFEERPGLIRMRFARPNVHSTGELPKVESNMRIPLRLLQDVGSKLRARQEIFHSTGGTHAVAIFDASAQIASFAEDIGRHNALDKAIGKCILSGRSPSGLGAFLSGRASYDIVAKCLRAGLEVLAAVSAPMSLAIETAAKHGLTLCGFVREDRATVFTCPHRILT